MMIAITRNQPALGACFGTSSNLYKSPYPPLGGSNCDMPNARLSIESRDKTVVIAPLRWNHSAVVCPVGIQMPNAAAIGTMAAPTNIQPAQQIARPALSAAAAASLSLLYTLTSPKRPQSYRIATGVSA